jgi:hypothetical protein
MPGSDPWLIVSYEVRMLAATCEIVLDGNALGQHRKVIANALEESAVLHTRILCEVFLSRGLEPDDIALGNLFPDYRSDAKYAMLTQLVDALRVKYGNAVRQGTPCWVFNKMMAHPTSRRGISYDYTEILRKLVPSLWRVIREVERLKGSEFTWSW